MYDLIKHYNYNKKEIIDTIKKILSKGILEMGPEVDIFEKNFANYCNSKYCITVSSGSMGLLLALKVLDLKKTDEVITVSNSDIPTSHAISLLGAKIKWVDVENSSFNINPKEVEKNITKNTKVILPVHLFGVPADMKSLKKISKKYKIKIVEDACLAAGSSFNQKKIGSIGDLTVFSTNPGKILDGLGHGGIITTNNHNYYQRLKKLRDYGRNKRPGKWPIKSQIIGFNSKLSTLDAAILNLRLKKINWYIKKRNLNANIYRELLNSKNIKFQIPYNNSLPAWRNFPIRVENRNFIYDKLYDKKFKVRLNYIPPNHLDTCYKKEKIKLPITEKISSEIINLPCHPYMKVNEIKILCKEILKLL